MSGRSFPFQLRLATVKSWQRVLLTGIAVALIGTQTIGLHHRIEHGSAKAWLASAAVAASEPANFAEDTADHASGTRSSTEHHCAAIDALALGDGPPATALHVPCRTEATTQIVAIDLQAPARSPASSFQARAPPVFLS
ncbi:MAG: hypothetical protein ACREBN_01690 [Burkholderiaceae bacterium]